jgi:hypothetical protein
MSTADALQGKIDSLRNDLTSVTFLVESLYFMHFRNIPSGECKLQHFMTKVRESYLEMAAPHERAGGDIENVFAAITASLGRIQARLSE